MKVCILIKTSQKRGKQGIDDDSKGNIVDNDNNDDSNNSIL